MTNVCGHLLCELIGMACSLATGRSRGCRPNLVAKDVAPEVIDEVRALLVVIEPATPDGEAVARVASEVDLVLDYLWGTVSSAVMPALCRRREAPSRALRWVLIGSVAGDELALSSVLLRKRNLQILGSGQGAASTADMFSVAPAIVAAFADGTLDVELREVPLAEVAATWSAPASGPRVVFVP